jgi:hypothetical protein
MVIARTSGGQRYKGAYLVLGMIAIVASGCSRMPGGERFAKN